MDDFNDNGHKSACSTASNTGDGDKGANVSSIMEAKLSIAICTAKYYEGVGQSIELNIME